MSDEKISTSPRRLRNHSTKQITLSTSTTSIPTAMSGNFEEICENIEPAVEELISKDDFQKRTTAQKLDSVAEAINKMYKKMQQVSDNLEEKLKPVKDAVFDEEEGILPQIQTMVDHAKTADSKIQSITEENLQLRDEVDVLKGIVHKVTNQIEMANSKIDNLYAKTMEGNLVISGIIGDKPRAHPRRQIHEFMYDQLELSNVHDEDILDVYRIGQAEKNKNRPMIIQVTQELKKYILSNTGKLKNKTNEEGGRFYVNPQLPESLAENRREIRQNIKERKEFEMAIPKENKSTFLVRANKLYINGQMKKKKLTSPTVMQLFPDDDEQKKINMIKLKYMRTKPEEGSKFKAAIFTPKTVDDVRRAHLKLFQDYPSADHIVAAFSVKGEQDYQDNGEYGAGFRLLKVIREMGMDNVAVFIIRHFGGNHLGPRRFTIMMDLARAALSRLRDLNASPQSPSMPGGSPSRSSDSQHETSDEDQEERNDEIKPNQSTQQQGAQENHEQI